MTATLYATTNPITGRMRPLNVLRDLPSVADLVELCFSSTLDPEGRSYIDQMRRNGLDKSFLNWAPRVIETVSLPLSGFVWENNGRVVGNVSMIPFFKKGQKIILIANVATHPEYRRQGIARKLTMAAMQRAREKHAQSIWLHVREDNPGAIQLYRELGFLERTRRTNWYASAGTRLTDRMPTNLQFATQQARDWPTQNAWLSRAYPPDIDWYQSQNWGIFKPGIMNTLYRLISDIHITQWSGYLNGRLQGVIACQHNGGRAEQLWAALPDQPNPESVTALLAFGRQNLGGTRNLNLEYPAGSFDDAIRRAGFVSQRTLAWMEAPGVQLSRA